LVPVKRLLWNCIKGDYIGQFHANQRPLRLWLDYSKRRF